MANVILIISSFFQILSGGPPSIQHLPTPMAMYLYIYNYQSMYQIILCSVVDIRSYCTDAMCNLYVDFSLYIKYYSYLVKNNLCISKN